VLDAEGKTTDRSFGVRSQRDLDRAYEAEWLETSQEEVAAEVSALQLLGTMHPPHVHILPDLSCLGDIDDPAGHPITNVL
jgi:hypothetical protein